MYLTYLPYILWLVLALAVVSLAEYTAHRRVLHSVRLSRRWQWAADFFEGHTVLHHGRFYRGGLAGDGDPAGPHVNFGVDPGFALVVTAPAWGALCLYSLTGGLILAGIVALHAAAWAVLHREMHEPRGRWWSRNTIFRALASHHEGHHQHSGRNLGFVFGPLWDVVFRTRLKQ